MMHAPVTVDRQPELPRLTCSHHARCAAHRPPSRVVIQRYLWPDNHTKENTIQMSYIYTYRVNSG